MHDALTLLSLLNDADIDWIMENGEEQQVTAGTSIIKEGDEIDSLYIVLEGLMGVYLSALPRQQLATVGPGELVGEISFIEEGPASASVTAVETSLLHRLSKASIRAKMQKDPTFAVRIYKAFAFIISRRLGESRSALGRQLREKVESATEASVVWQRLLTTIEGFKELIQQADRLALNHGGVLPEAISEEIRVKFRELILESTNELIGDCAPVSQVVKDELGTRLQREVLPYILLTQTAERFYAKPRGYAGDFYTIELIYRNQPRGTGRLGSLLDLCFLETPPARAVRNRRRVMLEEINRSLLEKGCSTTHITSLACGPATEVFDAFAQLNDPKRLKATLLDIDLQALAFVAKRRDKRKLQSQLHLEHCNLVYLATGRQRLRLRDQDLVYSLGLTDYFSDNFVIKLLDYIHSLLRPGGKVILGNFHPANRAKAFMEYVLEWRLIHRTEEDMNRLFQASSFKRPCTAVRFEEEGINLFAECVKE